MGDKNVHIIVVFFGFVLVALLTIHYVYYNGEEMIDKIDNFAYSYNSPFANYIGGMYYSSIFPPESDVKTTKRIRDIKQLVSNAQNMPQRKLLPKNRVTTKNNFESSEELQIRKSPEKRQSVKTQPSALDNPSNLFLSKDNTKHNNPPRPKKRKEKNIVVKDVAAVNGSDGGDDDDNGDSTMATTAFMVVVILPALVIVLVIAGLVASHMWTDLLFSGSKTSVDYSDDIAVRKSISGSVNTGDNRKSDDIESGLNARLVGKCMDGCTLISRGRNKRDKVSSRKRKSKKKRKPRRKKTVTFGDNKIVNYRVNPACPVIQPRINELLLRNMLDDLTKPQQSSYRSKRYKKRRNRKNLS